MTAARSSFQGASQRTTPVRAVPTQHDRSVNRKSHPSGLKRSRRSNRAIALEAGFKLIGTSVVAAAAIAALVRLVPHRQTQLTQLAELNTAVAAAEVEAQQLRQSFNRYFDPAQANQIRQEQSGRDAPNQKNVVLIEPTY